MQCIRSSIMFLQPYISLGAQWSDTWYVPVCQVHIQCIVHTDWAKPYISVEWLVLEDSVQPQLPEVTTWDDSGLCTTPLGRFPIHRMCSSYCLSVVWATPLGRFPTHRMCSSYCLSVVWAKFKFQYHVHILSFGHLSALSLSSLASLHCV